MHDVLRQRLLRKIESLPDEQIYQVLDYIEFLESKYVSAEGVTTSGLQKFAEGLEDKLRRRAVSPSTIREAFQLISAADRVLSGVSSAGRQILDDLGQALEVPEEKAAGGDDASGQSRPPETDGEGKRIEADPRKRRSGTSRSDASPTKGGTTVAGGSSTKGGSSAAGGSSTKRGSSTKGGSSAKGGSSEDDA